MEGTAHAGTAATLSSRAALLVAVALAGAAITSKVDSPWHAPLFDVAPIELVDVAASPDTARMRVAITTGGLSAEALVGAALVHTMHFRLAEPADARPCASLVCAVDLGRRVNADVVVWGRVTRVDSLVWVLTLSMASVSDSLLLRQETVEVNGDAHDVLPRAFRLLAERLALPGDRDLHYSARPGIHDDRSGASAVSWTGAGSAQRRGGRRLRSSARTRA